MENAMLAPTTIEIVKSALRADPYITPVRRKQYLDYLRNGSAPQTQSKTANCSAEPRVLSFRETAQRTNRSIRSVHLLCSQGILTKCKLPGRQRAAGVLSSQVDALLAASVQPEPVGA